MKNNNGLIKPNKLLLKFETENKLTEKSEKELKTFLLSKNVFNGKQKVIIKIGLKLLKLILSNELKYNFLTKENIDFFKKTIEAHYNIENFRYEKIVKHFKENGLEDFLLNKEVRNLNECLENGKFKENYFIKPLTEKLF